MKTKDLLKEWRSFINESGPNDEPDYGGPDDYDFTLDERSFSYMKEVCENILGDIDYDPNSFNTGIDKILYRDLKKIYEDKRDKKIEHEKNILIQNEKSLSVQVSDYSQREYLFAENILDKGSDKDLEELPDLPNTSESNLLKGILKGAYDVAVFALKASLKLDNPLSTVSSDDQIDFQFKNTLDNEKREAEIREAKLRDIIFKERIKKIISTYISEMKVIGFTEESMNVENVFNLARNDNVDYIFYNAKFVIDVEGNLYIKKKDGSLVSLAENIFPFAEEEV